MSNATQIQIVEVVLEEFGHAIEAELNTTDSQGDEGAIFASLIQGKPLTTEELALLHADNDAVSITIDGQVIAAEANTLTVTNTNSSGAGSLQEALSLAVNGDTITFASGMTITLTSQLAINKSITIDGDLDNNGTPDVTVSGGNTTRVFNIDDSTETVLNVAIDGLTIQNGNITGDGGGIYNAENLTLTNSILSGNNANYGGAIVNYGTATFTNSTLSGNNANYGGAIVNHGTATLTNSTVSANTSNFISDGIINYGTATFTQASLTVEPLPRLDPSQGSGRGILGLRVLLPPTSTQIKQG